MLKFIVLGLMSTILTAGSLVFKFVTYDTNEVSGLGVMFIALDSLKDFIVIFMMLWYVLK